MRKSIFYYKELTPAEVGKTGTHEVYVRLPNNFDYKAFFHQDAVENGSVLEIKFSALDITNGRLDASIEQFRFVYFANSNNEKRLPGLGPLFKEYDIQSGDIFFMESREENGKLSFEFKFIEKGAITLQPSQIYFSDEYEDEIGFEKPMLIDNSFPLQQIFYGAPGTGKSHEIKKLTKGESVIRTTFHPDSDYSTFVGCYKPTMDEVDTQVVPVVVKSGISLQDPGTYKEKRITYKFVMQAFLKAYLGAWKKWADAGDDGVAPQFLVIEEINRGNCAQIFGDLFQLLDRSDNNFSEYPIEADTDLQQEIERAFKEHKDYKLNKAIDAEGAVKDYISNYDSTLSEDIQSGRILLLPPNLYIWATMNTSDQSLFPIDSAFKRRWEWKYIKIAEGRDEATRELLNWTVKFEYKEDDKPFTFECNWWDFIKAINEKIAEATSSDDKKIGYFFCKPKDKNSTTIDEERFVGKVVFYLWNDVFKDEENPIFKVNEGKGEPSFDAFYKEDEVGKTIVDTATLRKFMHNVFGENKDQYTETEKSEE